jgi:hypothetical protein
VRAADLFLGAAAVGILHCGGGGTSNASATQTDGGANGSDVSTALDAPSDEDATPMALPGELSSVACPGAPTDSVPAGAPSCDTICGSAHCVPTAVAGVNPALPECPDDGTGIKGECVPDRLFEAGGKVKNATCTSSIANGLAECTPYCFAGMYKDVLKRDGCATGEVCAPCINPTNGKPTGACDDLCAAADAQADGPSISIDAEGGQDAPPG